MLAFSIAGRLLMGWLADHFSKKYVMLLTYLLVAARHPAAVSRNDPARALYFVCRRFWNRSGWGLHDHSADDGGNFWC